MAVGTPWSDARRALSGAVWILRTTGAPWHDLPLRYGPFQTSHRRFQQWEREGVLEGILWALGEDLLARGKLNLEESFIDASLVERKRGLWNWSDEAQQREQDPGNCRPPWSSYRRAG